MAGYSMNHFLESESSREEKAAKLLEPFDDELARRRRTTTAQPEIARAPAMTPPRAAVGASESAVTSPSKAQDLIVDRRAEIARLRSMLDDDQPSPSKSSDAAPADGEGRSAELEPPEAIVEPLAEAVVEPLAVAVVEPLAEAVADTADSDETETAPAPVFDAQPDAPGQPPSRPLADSLPSPDACALEGAAPPDPDASEDETEVAPPVAAVSRGDEQSDCGQLDDESDGGGGAPIAPDEPTAKPSGLIEFDDFSEDEDDTPPSPSAPAAALENVACALWEWLAPQCGIEALPLGIGGGTPARGPADRQLADVAAYADALRRARTAPRVLALLARLGPRGEAVGVEQLFATDVGRVVGRLARAHADAAVRARARSLVGAWKGAVRAAAPPIERELDALLAEDAPDEAPRLLALLARLGKRGDALPLCEVRCSMLGRTVSKLRDHEDRRVAARATELVGAWRAALEEAPPRAPLQPRPIKEVAF